MEDTTTVYSAFSLLLLIFAFKFLFYLKRGTKKLPPSPPSLPIIGHLHLLKPPMHRVLHKLSQKYGPIFSLRFGTRLVYVVSSPSIAKECFTTNDIVLANRPNFILTKYVAYNNTTVSTAPYGDHWRNLRRIMTIEILSTTRLNMSLGIRTDEIKRLICKLSRVSGNEFAKVELNSLFHELSFNIMTRMVAGKRYYGDDVTDEEQANKFRQISIELASYGGASNPGDFLPILNWINGGAYEKRVSKLSKNVDAFLQGLIEEHRSQTEGLESFNTMVDHLLSLQKSQPDYYTDQIIKGLMLNMILAGVDTSSVTLEWAMSNLINNPHFLKKATAEIDTEVAHENLVDEPDISKLHYLQSIILETLRLYPAAPLLVPHLSSDDCKIGGYDMISGTMLLVNAWAIHRNPELWDDPISFKPERFESGKIESHKLMPFGLGRRACPGEGLAQRIVLLTLGLLIQCFEWERVSDKETDMTEGRGITMPKAVPLEAMCKARPIIEQVFLLK